MAFVMGGGCRLENGQVWRVSVLRDPRSRWIGARGPPLLSGAERKRPSGPFCFSTPVPGDSEDPDLPLPEASRDFPAFSGSSQGLGTGDVPRGALRACG